MIRVQIAVLFLMMKLIPLKCLTLIPVLIILMDLFLETFPWTSQSVMLLVIRFLISTMTLVLGLKTNAMNAEMGFTSTSLQTHVLKTVLRLEKNG